MRASTPCRNRILIETMPPKPSRPDSTNPASHQRRLWAAGSLAPVRRLKVHAMASGESTRTAAPTSRSVPSTPWSKMRSAEAAARCANAATRRPSASSNGGETGESDKPMWPATRFCGPNRNPPCTFSYDRSTANDRPRRETSCASKRSSPSGRAEQTGAFGKLLAKFASSGSTLLLSGLFKGRSRAVPGVLNEHHGQDGHGYGGHTNDDCLGSKAVRGVPGHG